MTLRVAAGRGKRDAPLWYREARPNALLCNCESCGQVTAINEPAAMRAIVGEAEKLVPKAIGSAMERMDQCHSLGPWHSALRDALEIRLRAPSNNLPDRPL